MPGHVPQVVEIPGDVGLDSCVLLITCELLVGSAALTGVCVPPVCPLVAAVVRRMMVEERSETTC